MTKERIEIIRQSLIPFVKKELLKINYEGLGKSDAEEFEKDLNEVLDLASKALEQQSSEDCVSRQAVDQNIYDYAESNRLSYANLKNAILDVPSVTPTHGTCKDCKYNVKDKRTTTMCDIGHRFFMREPSTFYCADFEKRGGENVMDRDSL